MKTRMAQALSLAVVVVAGTWLYIQPGPEPLITLLAGTVALLSFRPVARERKPISSGSPPGGIPEEPNEGAGSREASVAVLPFRNLGEESDTDYFSEGIAEDLIARLAKIEGLKVTSHSSVMRAHGLGDDFASVARRLGVASVVEGSVRRTADRIRIVVQLTDVPSGQHLWAERYDRELTDVMAIQADVAESVAESLGLHLSAAGIGGEVGAVHPEAYRLHLLGRFHANKWSEAGWEKAVEHLERAIELDSTFAAPRATLAYSYGLRAYMHTLAPREAFLRAEQQARLALALDPGETDAHMALGLVSYWLHWDWDQALASLRRAVEISPGNSTAQSLLGVLLDTLGRHREAMDRRRTAYDLDPLDPTAAFNLGYGLLLGRRFAEAARQFERALELDPRSAAATYGLGMSQVDGGDPELGCRTFERGIREVDGSSTMLGFLGWARGMAGRKDEARRILAELTERRSTEIVSSYHLGLVFLGLEEHDELFACLERAYAERSTWMTWFHVTPSLDCVRGDPRFVDLVKRMGLPTEVAEAEPFSFTGRRSS